MSRYFFKKIIFSLIFVFFCFVSFFIIKDSVLALTACEVSCGVPSPRPGDTSYQECCSDSSSCNPTSFTTGAVGYCVASGSRKSGCQNIPASFCCSSGLTHTMYIHKNYWYTSADCSDVGFPEYWCQCEEAIGGACSGNTNGVEGCISFPGACCDIIGGSCSGGVCTTGGPPPTVSCDVSECQNRGYLGTDSAYCAGSGSCSGLVESFAVDNTVCLSGVCTCCDADYSPPIGSCEVRWPGGDTETCPLTCTPGSIFNISYEYRATDYPLANWIYRGIRAWNTLYGSWRDNLWCDDNTQVWNNNWVLETKTVNCSDLKDVSPAVNLMIGCYADNDGVFAGGNWCDQAILSTDDSLACSVDIVPAEIVSLGYLKLYHQGLGTIKLNLISVANALSKSPFPGTVKVARFNGDTNSAADLVATSDPMASPVRIYTGLIGTGSPKGIWSWKKLP